MDGANGKRGSVAVATIGKFKTTAQMIAIFLLLIGTDKYNDPFYLIGNILMFIASVLTIWSMCYYLKMAWKNSNKIFKKNKNKTLDAHD